MIGLLVTLVTVLVLLAAACAVGLAVTVLPFVLGVDMAEKLGLSTARWGAVSLGGIALALALAWEAVRLGLPLVVLPLAVLTWVGPGVLALLDASQVGLGGRQGAHER